MIRARIVRYLVIAAVGCGGILVAMWAAFCEDEQRIADVDPVPALTIDRAFALQAKIQDVYARRSPCVVRLWTENADGEAVDVNGYPAGDAYSGVIIEPTGLILTCAHHGYAPETKLTIQLADGKRVTGKILGRFQRDGLKSLGVVPDLGLAKITDPGEWPAAVIDANEPREAGRICMAIGYPAVLRAGRPPLLRIGRTLPRFPGLPWRETTSTVFGGDSGGPLFDLAGRVVGIASGGDGVTASRYQIVTFLNEYQERLEAGEIVSGPEKEVIRVLRGSPAHPSAFVPLPDLEDRIQQVRRSVVQIKDGPNSIAAGLIITADGLAITKASLVARRPEWPCRLFYVEDKAIVKGRVVATSPEYDLALMKLDLRQWFVAPWSENRPAVGTIVASPLGVRPLQFSVVGAEESEEPAIVGVRPQIPLSVERTEQGPPVVRQFEWDTAEFDSYRELLQSGDVITSLNGTPTPTTEVFWLTYNRMYRAPGSFHGDWIRVGLRRNAENFTVHIPKIHSANAGDLTWHSNPLSLRREAFPAVISHDGRIRPEQCGGPLVDLDGSVIGLNIARTDPTRTLAIPADVLQKIIADLRLQAGETEKP